MEAAKVLELEPATPQRVAIVIEQVNHRIWGVCAYLVTADGLRHRRALANRPTYAEATEALRKVWERIKPLT